MQNLPSLSDLWKSNCPAGRFKVFLVATLLVLISGCAVDKFDSSNRAGTTVPASLPNGPVALMMSDSAIETAKELEAYNRHYKSGLTAGLYMSSIREAYAETSDPERSVAEVTRMLEARFGKVQRVHSLEEASRTGFKLVAKLDIRTRLISDRSSDPASYLSLDFYNASQQYLGTVQSMSRRTLTPVWTGYKREKEIVSDIRQQGEIQAHALELLKETLASIPAKN
ncbi:hypothetical protein [Pseudomonas caspiana]|uniref:hypothetical protein n=1 Tax=Pseudomonas caspiana TaxID=1451454 RepID=UPI0032EAFF2E